MSDDNSSSGMAPSSTRTVWKGAISFGLVHVPVGLYSATVSSGIDFDWLDKRTMDPVGYKRINKKTGKEIAMEDIVKGVEYDDGRYVVLSPEEISKAYPKTTQTIEIEAFVDADEVPFVYLEKPYYTAPINRGEKVYALLREALRKSNKVGIAKVVIASKQLAVANQAKELAAQQASAASKNPLTTIQAFNALGTTSSVSILVNGIAQTFSLANGQNFFGIQATGGDRISSISFDTNGVGVVDLRQLRIGGVATVAAVPEPGTWAMMLIGFGGMGVAMRRTRRRSSAPIMQMA